MCEFMSKLMSEFISEFMSEFISDSMKVYGSTPCHGA